MLESCVVLLLIIINNIITIAVVIRCLTIHELAPSDHPIAMIYHAFNFIHWMNEQSNGRCYWQSVKIKKKRVQRKKREKGRTEITFCTFSATEFVVRVRVRVVFVCFVGFPPNNPSNFNSTKLANQISIQPYNNNKPSIQATTKKQQQPEPKSNSHNDCVSIVIFQVCVNHNWHCVHI